MTGRRLAQVAAGSACFLATVCDVQAGNTVSDVRTNRHEPLIYVEAAAASIVYTPAKIAFAGLGAVTSGASWLVTFGRTEPSRTIWNASVEGDYVITPRMLEGREPINFAGDAEPARAQVSSSKETIVPSQKPARKVLRNGGRAAHGAIHTAALQDRKLETRSGKSATLHQQPMKSKVIVHGVTFERQRAKVDKSSRPLLDTAAEALRESPNARLVIAGDASQMNGDAHLRLQRAAAVRSYLIGHGAESEHVVAFENTPPEMRVTSSNIEMCEVTNR